MMRQSFRLAAAATATFAVAASTLLAWLSSTKAETDPLTFRPVASQSSLYQLESSWNTDSAARIRLHERIVGDRAFTPRLGNGRIPIDAELHPHGPSNPEEPVAVVIPMSCEGDKTICSAWRPRARDLYLERTPRRLEANDAERGSGGGHRSIDAKCLAKTSGSISRQIGEGWIQLKHGKSVW